MGLREDVLGSDGMSEIGFGVIGCGRISENHLQALAKAPGTRLQCVADVNAELAQGRAEQHGASAWVADYRELLAMSEVDAVVVCAPTFLHAEIVCAAAETGKHVLCEKPIAMKLEDAERMIAFCEGAGVRFMVGFVRHYSPQWLKLREIIVSGRIGRPVIWRNTVAIRIPPLRWFVDADRGGGPFIDGCVHDYDFARAIFGEAEWAMGSLMRFSETTTALDTGTAVIHFESGDELMRSWSWGLPGPSVRMASTEDVIGPGGGIRFPTAEEGSALFVVNGDGSEEPMPYEQTTGQDWFDRQMAEFVACIREKREPLASGTRGIRALEIALAVLRAGQTHELVSI